METLTRDQMVQVMQDRDSSYEGSFFIGVKTTGIFCKPGCPARTPKEENVEFFGSIEEAVAAGYRPCLRCKPTHGRSPVPTWLADLLNSIERSPNLRITDKDLTNRGLLPARVRRAFLNRFGMTFQAYCRRVRMSQALPDLRAGSGVFQAALEHGYDSDSGFRDAFSSLFGVPTGHAGKVSVLTAKIIESPLGPIVGIASGDALVLLEFHDRRALANELAWVQRHFKSAVVPGTNEILDCTERQLREYFAGTLKTFDLPLYLQGSEFQVRCWRALLDIPYGETRSYADQAKAVGSPTAVRAVGTANGANRLCIVIPCHRVIASDGSPAGYGGGIWRKLRLLEIENPVD